MYISNLRLWNFRTFGSPDYKIDLKVPHLEVDFKSGINVLIGENDTGKTAIIDAIRYVLRTHAYERLWVSEDDFYFGSPELRIEIIIKGLSSVEASHFTEWLGWDDVHSEEAIPFLRLIFLAKNNDNGIWISSLCAGTTPEGSVLDYEAREYLKITYLRPLRDAEDELTAKKASRLSQILSGHKLFKKKAKTEEHPFECIVKETNHKIEEWFRDDSSNEYEKSHKEQIKDIIDRFLKEFISDSVESNIFISNPDIKSILEKLSLNLIDQIKPGLGSHNRLYMAAELLHLIKDEWSGIRTCLIEELEAHLHPQAQMKVIEALEKEENVQFIITTHSPNLTSKINIADEESTNLILCKDKKAYSLYPGKTLLDKSDYKYLQHFLDVTKANMFFAAGVIMVEGWSEAILLPVIANSIEKDLTRSEISIVNIGSTAYMHFAKIYMPLNGTMDFPVSILTDLDIFPDKDGKFDSQREISRLEHLVSQFDTSRYPNVQIMVAKQWTLEWCLYNSTTYKNSFMDAVSKVHSSTLEFKKGDDEQYDEKSFKYKLIEKLKNRSLNKVAIAYELAKEIKEKNLIPQSDDKYIEYILDAINHVCK